jgi:hypothetical protein
VLAELVMGFVGGGNAAHEGRLYQVAAKVLDMDLSALAVVMVLLNSCSRHHYDVAEVAVGAETNQCRSPGEEIGFETARVILAAVAIRQWTAD